MSIKEYSLLPDPRVVAVPDGTEKVYLQIIVGNGQIGGSVVYNHNEVLAKGDMQAPRYVLSTQDAESANLGITTNVFDVNMRTDQCVITTQFLDQNGELLYKQIDNGLADSGGIASFRGNYVFRLLICLLLLNTGLSMVSSAQAPSTELTIQDLEMPSSPGFILYDQAPEAIERPTTPQGLGVSAINAFQKGGALEFSPFWLTNHPGYTASKAIKENLPVLSELSLSLAYIDQDTIGRLAIGGRTRVYQFYGTSTIHKLDSIRLLMIDVLSTNAADIDTAKLASLSKEYSNFLKPAFTIDLAAAYGGSSISNSIQDLAADKWAVWISATFRPRGGDFYITGLGRYSKALLTDIASDDQILDLGARINYEWSNFSISGEFLSRSNAQVKTESFYRYALIGAYKISENLYVTGSMGKNFEEINNLFMVGGVNFGFSESKSKVF